MGTLDDDLRAVEGDTMREADALLAEVERLRAQDREVRGVLRAALTGRVEDAATTVQLARSTAGLLASERIRADRAEGVVRELRSNGRKTDLQAARDGIRRYGAPPPGEDTHPLQGHRDSMG